MFHFSKKSILLTTLLAGVPVVLFFQNCGQPGSLSTSNISSAVTAKTTTDSLVVLPSTDSSHNQTISLDKPPLSINENPGAASSDSSSSAKGSIGSCGNMIISDILLKISSMSFNCEKPNELGFQILESDKSISLDKLNVKVRALKTDKVKEIFFLLNSSGNKILTTENVALDLVISDNQQIGIKVKLSEEFSVVEGKSYNLEIAINPSEQVITNKNKCIFKPIVRDVLISAL